MVKLFTSQIEIQAKTGIMLTLSYLALFAANTLTIYLANLFFPTHVVLGTFALTPFWALVLSMGKFSLLGTMVMPLVAYREWKTGKTFSNRDWMSLYFVVNAATLYLVTRFASIYGLGVSSWLVVVALAVVLDMVQGIFMMNLGKIKIS